MSSETSSQPPDPSDVSGADISGPYGASYNNSVSFREKEKPEPTQANPDVPQSPPLSPNPSSNPVRSAKFALAQAGVHTIQESPRLGEKECMEDWVDVEEGVKKRSRDAAM